VQIYVSLNSECVPVLSVSAEIRCLAYEIYFQYRNNKSRKPMILETKVAFNKKKAIFTWKLGLNLRKKLVMCYNCSVALYGA